MAHDATAKDVDRVVSIIEEMGYQARPMPGAQRTAVGLVGNDGRVDASRIEALPGVAQIRKCRPTIMNICGVFRLLLIFWLILYPPTPTTGKAMANRNVNRGRVERTMTTK